MPESPVSRTDRRAAELAMFAKFMAVGGIGLVIDAGTFFIFSRVVGLTMLVAQGISFSLAVINNFFWNRHWTFPDARSKSARRQLVQFYVTSVAGLIIRSFSIAVTAPTFSRLAAAVPIGSLSPDLVSDYASLFTAIAIVSAWNYIVNRLWTFRDA